MSIRLGYKNLFDLLIDQITKQEKFKHLLSDPDKVFILLLITFKKGKECIRSTSTCYQTHQKRFHGYSFEYERSCKKEQKKDKLVNILKGKYLNLLLNRKCSVKQLKLKTKKSWLQLSMSNPLRRGTFL